MAVAAVISDGIFRDPKFGTGFGVKGLMGTVSGEANEVDLAQHLRIGRFLFGYKPDGDSQNEYWFATNGGDPGCGAYPDRATTCKAKTLPQIDKVQNENMRQLLEAYGTKARVFV